MEFRNFTAFPALAFEGIDQRGEPFHVVALRQTFRLGSGRPILADDQDPLRLTDTYFGEVGHSAVREESDLCQFKPKCDVMVIGSAHAPAGRSSPRFTVRLRVYRPGEPPPLPPPPQGLNPLMSASPEAIHEWRQACKRQRESEPPGELLIDKTLAILGDREFRRRSALFRGFAHICRVASLGLLRPDVWRLTEPQPCDAVRLTPDRAYGGEHRVLAGNPAAASVPKGLRLAAGDAVVPGELVAWTAFAPNPHGVGWAQGWFLRASNIERIPAPNIEWPSAPIDTALFRSVAAGHAVTAAYREPPGFGVRAKTHPDRAKLIGQADGTFASSDDWLPDGFDFAVWNAAPPNQQIDYPSGGEIVELTNLCAPNSWGAGVDEGGNTRLQFALPGDRPFVFVRFENGSLGELAAQLDTIVVDTDRGLLSCVWRATLAKSPAVRVLEARIIPAEDVGRSCNGEPSVEIAYA